jgi:hypothetical protein
VRRSQTYDVEVFDQIPTLDQLSRAITAADDASACSESRPTELLKALLDKMDKVVHRRLHPASAAMLELGEEEKKIWSVSRSFRSL